MNALPVSPLSSRSIVIFAGPFGAGKTEIAINYSLASIAAGRETRLADLDVVTPYFRAGDYRDKLAAYNLRVLAAPGALASFENPALPPELLGALRDRVSYLVLDVGGDPVGARLLGTFSDHLLEQNYELWMVINPFRLKSSSASALKAMRYSIEVNSGLQFTGVVANPHLGKETEASHLETGWRVVNQIAEELGLPIAFTAVAEYLLELMPVVDSPILPLRLYLHLPWERKQERPKN